MISKRIWRVPCPDGIPLTRLHQVQCLCGHKFTVDLGVEWKPNLVVLCPKCRTRLGKTTEVVSSNWQILGETKE